MNNAIRHTWLVSVGLFVVLFAALSLIQVALTEELNSHPNNVRQVYQDRGAPRGAITVDGTAIAESVPSEGTNFDYQRVYHDPFLYSGITGFYSIAAESTGLENSMNDYLTGQSDSQFFDRITSLFTGETLEGAQVELTLDPELQQLAYDTIPDGTRGSIIVSEVGTGEIKAMASKPSYDTNLLAVHSTSQFQENIDALSEEDGLSAYRFRPVYDTIAPGSTFKLIDLVAMLDSGDFDADTVMDNPSEIELPQSNRTLSNFFGGICDQQSEADLHFITAQSCNTPFAETAMEMGQEPIREAAEAFGWNQNIDFPLTVSPSQFPEVGSDAELAYASIGQASVTSTPLQMNMVAMAIANGGTLMQPTLIESVRAADLQVIERSEPEVFGEPISEDVAEELTELMQGPVESGTAWRGQSDRFDIAAKTGTAQIGDDSNLVHSWITGFAPADDPQYAVTVVYERIDYDYGSSLTAPNMRTMLEAVIEE
ncbi:penicillin-binding transpeptidase domain-containing protein [Nesterenkonia sp. HG001]|uniref:penicillin-binding transpeptidase domain-containing protein n=1 Tax=Nesterenkonia sp. HG001 TaxID=2983207 RepID=UPI002AC5850E|nr:penicillin-binding transpeptidase domain-containing protein [Nesterenkonia sp. HG001]MDZ5077407.1 penicillin-binding transpeptidase domain-containing protein [Nesterenkonia sp. HG001]